MVPAATDEMDATESAKGSSKVVSSGNKAANHGFLCHKEFIEEGDTVMIYINFGTVCAVEVKRGCTLNMKYGALRHEFLIGKRYGSRVSASAGYVFALRPSAQLWTRTLQRRTQILYPPDCALILTLLDAKPGMVICESGTGSGSLSHALAMAVAPSGHLYTHDIEETRVKQVERELQVHGMGDITTCVNQNVCEDGFFVENACDGVFLDLPAPWNAISHSKRALSRVRGGRIVSFSPCIEQVQKTSDAMRRLGFVQVETVELVPRKLKVVDLSRETLEHLDSLNSVHDEEAKVIEEVGAKRRKLDEDNDIGRQARACSVGYTVVAYPAAQPTHTGYLTSATLLPSPLP